MSIYSTKTVGRDFAIRTLVGRLYTATNEELADLLFTALGDETLNNYIVEDSPSQDKE